MAIKEENIIENGVEGDKHGDGDHQAQPGLKDFGARVGKCRAHATDQAATPLSNYSYTTSAQ